MPGHDDEPSHWTGDGRWMSPVLQSCVPQSGCNVLPICEKKANVPLSELTWACFWEAHSNALPEGFRERTLIWFQGVPFPLVCGCSQRSLWPTQAKKAYTENKDFRAESPFSANLSQLLKVSEETFLHKDI